MGITFNIREQSSINYEEAKKIYIKGLRGKPFMKTLGIGKSQYTRLLERFREDGLPIPTKGYTNILSPPRNYHRQSFNGYTYWVVCKVINYKKYYFGHYKTEEEAQKRVEELRKNNWNGLLK